VNASVRNVIPAVNATRREDGIVIEAREGGTDVEMMIADVVATAILSKIGEEAGLEERRDGRAQHHQHQKRRNQLLILLISCLSWSARDG
jgi:hypothetical protein